MDLTKEERTTLRTIYHHLQKQKGLNKTDRGLIDSICVELIKPKKFSKKQLESLTLVCTQILEQATYIGTQEEFDLIKSIVNKAINDLTELTLKGNSDATQTNSKTTETSGTHSSITPFTLPNP